MFKRKFGSTNTKISYIRLSLTIDNKYYVTGTGSSNLMNETMRVESMNTIILKLIFQKVMEVKIHVVKF